MKKIFTPIIVVVAFAAGVICTSAFSNATKSNTGAEAHPRIAKAITSLQDAIDYLNSAPDVFQGHKALAIARSNEAINQLKICESYPAK
jgi:hypothetical protein